MLIYYQNKMKISVKNKMGTIVNRTKCQTEMTKGEIRVE